jgi:alpha-sarcoglycan
MSFRVAKKKNVGYLYGSAPESYAGRKIDIEIIALNKSNYETSRIVLPINIFYKPAPIHTIEMKFTNLDWVNLTNVETVSNLKDIFSKELWPESALDLSIVFMESAIKLGGRRPLNPNNSEGVIIHLGSNARLSNRLIELDQEVKPLLKLTTCTFKKTSEQKVFHKLGFQPDWCAFRIGSLDEIVTVATKDVSGEEASMLSRKVWTSIARDELPERSYSEEVAIAIAIPSVIFAFLVALLTVVLCFQHDKL